ncbi:MAG TPA: glucose-1-phosphate adenylyltransferase, partial [Nitrosomonas sp.]|nr:glucose-1-phosphate adenylyltransferase [Nitrosomonas sp.]
SMLFSNVKVNSYSVIEDSVILPNVEIRRNARLRRVVVEKRCVIPEGLMVGYNKEEDRQRFRVTEKGVTLITPEMLGQDLYPYSKKS